MSRRLELGCTKGGARWGLEGVLARRRRTSGGDGGKKWVLVDTEEEWFELERERELERVKAEGMVVVGPDGTSTQPVQDKIKHWQMNLPGTDYNPLPPSSIPLAVPSSLPAPVPLPISAPTLAPPAPENLAAPSPQTRPLSSPQPQPQPATSPTDAESSTVRKAERVKIWQADLDLAAAGLVGARPAANNVVEAVAAPPPSSMPVPVSTTKLTAPAPAPILANKAKSKGKGKGREVSKDPSPLGFPVVKRASASSMKPGHAPSHALSQELAHEPPPKLPKPAKAPRPLEDDLIPSSLPAESVVGIAAAAVGKGEDVEMGGDAVPCKGAVVTIKDVSEMVSNTIKFTLFNPTQDEI